MNIFRKAFGRAWGLIARTPRLPHQSGTGPSAVLYTATPSSVVFKPMSEIRAAPQPAPSPARQSWAAYAKNMASHQSYPGWTFCKFGVRGPGENDHADVQGIVRAPFGAWWSPFLCVDDALNYKVTRGLACVEHTPTGMAIGVFTDMDLAVEAAEIAMRMADWSTFSSIDEVNSATLIHRVRSAWAAIGIGFNSRFEAIPMVHGKVPEGMPRVGIFMKAPIEQRPERLS